MANHWFENSKKNLFSKSEENSDFNTARDEWIVTGKIIDNYEDLNFEDDLPDISCELCEHEQIRWQFEIINEKNNNSMMVGSSCIDKFDIKYIKNGKLLSSEDRKIDLNNQIQKIMSERKYEQGLISLRLLYKANKKERDIITRMGLYFKSKKKLEPGMAVFVSRKMEDADIEYKHSWYNIYLRDDYSRFTVKEMDDDSYGRLVPFLTKEQFARCEKLRNRKNK